MPNKPTVLNSMLLLLVGVVVSKPLEKNLKSLKNLVFTLPTMKKQSVWTI